MLTLCSGCGEAANAEAQAAPPPVQDAIRAHADQLIDEGRQTFRSDTFGDQTFWGDTIKLHQAIAGSAHGTHRVFIGATAPRHSRGCGPTRKGGFFHDGRLPTLAAVVDHYNSFFGLGLTSNEQSDLIEYLKSL